MKMLFIYNPVSGKSGNRENRLGRALLELGKHCNEISVYQMKAKGDGLRFLSEKDDLNIYDTLVVCGGDGTLHEMVDACLKVGFKGQIGYIPAGSCNDYASNLGISPRNAIQNIIDRRSVCLDVGNLNGEFFNYVAAFGILTDVSYSTPQNVKNSIGYLAYVLEGAKELRDMKPIHIRCETDEEIIEDDILVGIITNTLSVGGVKLKEEDISLNDGLMEYVFIKYPQTLIELQTTLLNLVNMKFDSRYMYSGQSRHFVIDSDTMQWTLDGENGGGTEHAVVETHGNALRIIVGD